MVLIILCWLFLDLGCLCDHPLVTSILNKEILRIQLLTLWDTTRASSDINNKYKSRVNRKLFNNWTIHRNLRFSSYRSLYFWIYGKKNHPTKKFRLALPSCLVSLVRDKYPEEEGGVYTGFVNKLPGIIFNCS